MENAVNKDLINFASSRDAKSFTDAVNNLLAQKAESVMAQSVPQVASNMFKGGYLPKAEGELDFEDKHTIQAVDYPVENEGELPFKPLDMQKADHDGQPGDKHEGAVEEETNLEEVHSMAVHVKPVDKSYNKFEVVATGSKVTYVKKGDKLSSSALDDLTDAGHKVKELKEDEQLEEKTLTKAEMSKREDIAMALKKKMGHRTEAQKSKLYAIATAQAKKSA